MKKEIDDLEKCLSDMRRCYKLNNVENCVCFYTAFKILLLEARELESKYKNNDKFETLRKEIEDVWNRFTDSEKDCLGCQECVAQVIYEKYPKRLRKIYLEDGI